ncbi:TonB-dependent receptor [Aquincola sp. S2]|uniref:TonB-dependent receptor n=1 Tax=Pseudaquabacterium terrae TaxID=2732868 RepID=A0ABX2E970_9BURK|nr:TonB-dependent receptor [Aquabacterium terrae]NRF65510.1 TonB-dependent receptor [Aquabacterium terrae]
MTRFRPRLSRIALGLLALPSGIAWAQAPEQVIVTAQSRSQQAQTVPISMQVLSPDEVRKLGASNLADLNGYLPGFTIDNTQATQPMFSLRGIGTEDFLIGTDSPVGFYVDGVYTGKTGGALLNFNDLKRIEVLKGPQGTLFGRNSAGGAISVITNAPAAAFAANGLVRAGNHGARQAQAMLNQPLGENFALRMSAVAQRSNGWARDAGSGQREGGDDAWGARIALRWSPSDATSATLTLEHEKLDQRARPAFGIVAEPPAGSAPPFPADPARHLDPLRAPLYSDVEGNREARDFDGATLRIHHALGWADFSSTTAGRHFRSLNRQDNDGTRRFETRLETANIEANTTWQQEFRLAGKRGAFDWVAGLSFFSERAEQTSDILTNTSSLDTLFGNVAGLPAFSTVNLLSQLLGLEGIDLLGQPWNEAMHNRARNRAAALYGDVIWQWTPATRLTAGLRLTRDHKRFSWSSPPRRAPGLDAQLDALDAAGFFPGLVEAGALTPEEAGALQAVMRQSQLLDSRGAEAAPVQVERRWTDASPRLVLDQQLGRDWMGYASWTRGYQAGGFNGLAVNGRYEPEKVVNVELGLKGGWPAQGVLLNAALFHYRFTNLQTLDLVPSANQAGIPAYQVTVSDQRATGLDVEGQWAPSRAWRFFGSAEWINQTYRRHQAPDGSNAAGVATGTPRLSAAGGVEGRWPLAGGQFSARLSAAYTGARRCNADTRVQGTCLETPAFRVGGARERLDGRLGWDSADGRFGVALIANNLLDKRYVTRLWTLSEGLGTPYVTLTPPRSVLLELRASI